MASRKMILRSMACALALALSACGGGGSSISSPGASNSGSLPGGGGGTGGSGGGTAVCPNGTTNAGGLGAETICNITGRILSNFTLQKLPGIVYRLNGRVDVGNDLGSGTQSGFTLTIEPGVRVFGATAGDILVVNRGNKISAVGTLAEPIIFTSRQDLLGQNDVNTSNRQWGGVILLGRAPIRGCNTAVVQGTAGCINEVEGVTAATGSSALYGGATPADDSGTMNYVQIRYPGAFLSSAAAGDDLNGLTLGGVGSATNIRYVQVHNSGDDGIEVFGGTVNMKNIVITGALDDSLDFDEGWTGNVQFAVGRQTLLGGGPDRLIEGSNRPVSGVPATPTAVNTFPTIANFTFVGVATNSTAGAISNLVLNNTPDTTVGSGNALGSSGRFVNGILTGSTTCVDAQASNSSLSPVFRSLFTSCATRASTSTASGAASTRTTGILDTAGTNNLNGTNSLGGFSGLLAGTNEQATTATDPTTLGAFFEAANYVGAFPYNATDAAINPVNNWAAGWTINLLPTPTCPAGTTAAADVTVNGGSPLKRCVLSGTIGANGVPADIRLVAGFIYEVQGRVDVGVDQGAAFPPLTVGSTTFTVANYPAFATLAIDPGVVVFGNSADDLLIVNRGSRLFVNGTTSAPVLMTSLGDVVGGNPSTVGRRCTNPSCSTTVDETVINREWGGLILLGRAPIKGCATAVTQGTVGCQNAVEGVTVATGRQALYGGATAGDNSGTIRNLQIRYPGNFLTGAAAGDDINGLTMGGVGSGTTISNVQVHNSGDDGIEIFGGTVNMRNLVVTDALDDAYDFDEGYVGKIQYALGLQTFRVPSAPLNVNATTALVGGPDRLAEWSNRPVAGTVASPQIDTNPILANFTFIGTLRNDVASGLTNVILNNTPLVGEGTAANGGSSGRLVNGIITNSTTCVNAQASNIGTVPQFRSIFVVCPTIANTAIASGADPITADAAKTANLLAASGNGNVTASAAGDTLASLGTTYPARFAGARDALATLTGVAAPTAIDPRTAFSGTADTFFDNAAYVGAINPAISDTRFSTWTCGLANAATNNC